ncbi:hypothetical protein KOW79_006704 [Hemibagrus wyckioides]|uniref:Ig-like domain-containing protein n=1 Tax=Hemibagrus wyckioides TaxID=337641 RepID=A0A9D3P0X4_9TELE|nr:hypothetical protein KOW79_006704 [Hemibagrus wyckioides]
MIWFISLIQVGKVQADNKPVLTVQPNTPQIFRGETVTLSCRISGGSGPYIWFKDDGFVYRSAEKDYTIKVDQSNRYSCYGFKNGRSTARSNEVTLSVIEKPKPKLTSNHEGDVLTGNSVTLSCTLKLQSAGWKFYWIKPTQSSETETDSYTISSVRVSDGGHYWCRAGRGNPVYYTDYSNALWVNVIERPKAVVTIKPDKHVFRGETVILRCEIQGGGDTEWTYSWYKNDDKLVQITQEFSLSSVRNEDSGNYTCRGRRSSDTQTSEISDAVTLTVSEKPKPKLTSNHEGDVLTGNSVTLSCTLKLQSAGWKFYWIKPTQSSENETETDSYTISSVRVSDGGQYWCRAGRGTPVYYTQYSDSLWVNVTESPKAVVTIKPDKHVFRGETVTLRCEIQGGGEAEWTYSWYKNDYKLYREHKIQEFSLRSVRNEDSGKYTCRGRRSSDTQGSEISDAVTLTISEKPKPKLTSNHEGDVLTGNSVTLSCTLKLQSAGWKFYWIKPTQSSETETETDFYIISSVRVSDGDGAVILDSPVHPVTEGHPLTLRCLYRSKMIPGSGVDFYKDDSILQSQTTGEMTISSVSKSDEGFYHCKHPERGESLKSWVSVRLKSPGSNTVPVAVAVGLSLALLFIIFLLTLLWKHKSNKRKDRGIQQNSNQTPGQSQSGAEDSQSGYTPLQTGNEHIYATMDNADHDAGPSDVTYAELELKPQKKARKKQVKANVEPDTVYSELKQNT